MAVLFGIEAPACSAQRDADLTELLRIAVEKIEMAKKLKMRFTYLDRNHTQNFLENGKLLMNQKQLFEVTYIADLEYSRLLEEDGKPITGKALKKEQKRYDDAVRERSALDMNARAKLQNHWMKDSGIHLSLLPQQYRNVLVAHAPFNGEDCLVIDSFPLPGAPQKQYRLWIEPTRKELLRMDFDQIATEGDIMKGGTGSETWTYIDGIPLTSFFHIDAKILVRGTDYVQVVMDDTYSGFRKFSVTTTILPVEPKHEGGNSN